MKTMQGLLEIIKTSVLIEYKRRVNYKISFFSELAIFLFAYLSIFIFTNSSDLQEMYQVNASEASILVMIGFIFWNFGVLALGKSSSSIQDDARIGILENKIQSNYSITLLTFIETLVVVTLNFVFILLLIIGTFLFVDLPLSKLLVTFIESCLIVLPAVIGMFGICLIFSGLSLVEKSIGQFIMICQALLLFVANVSGPIEHSAQYIIPYAFGVDIMRSLFSGQGFSVITFLLYLAINLFWLLIGVGVFNFFLKKEKLLGSFDTF